MRVLFIEPPKEFWFILGEYVPPPLGILTLASYIEAEEEDIDIEVVDCQAERLDWSGLERRIASFRPDIVAPSGLSSCNAYAILRTAELAKKVAPEAKTVLGGQHFTALSEETLERYPFVDIVVRGEGEKTLAALVRAFRQGSSLADVQGITFRHGRCVIRTGEQPLFCNLDLLPMPGYHFVRDHMKQYYFSLMAEKNQQFAIVEGSRGCMHNCSYCTQWGFWNAQYRSKSPKRIAEEFEQLHDKYGSSFFWLTDDNFGLGPKADVLCEEIINRGIAKDLTWFLQARCDDIVQNKKLLPKLRRAGNIWMLVGFDSSDPETLVSFRRGGVSRMNAKKAADLLRQNGILCQGTFVIGNRRDSRKSMEELREYADWLDPDIATFMTLTPFPGTEIYETAKQNGWIEDENWSNYDMIHAIMPTEYLTRHEIQEELYECYRSYFGSWRRRYRGLFSDNSIIRRTYQYLAREALMTGLRSLF